MPEIIVKLGDSIVQKNIFVKETIRIGRVPENEIMVENLAVSRYHAVIEYKEDRYILTDLESSNGTFVNGVRIKKTELQDRDVITVGKHKLYFYDHRAMAEPKPRPTVVDIERTMLMDASTAAPGQAEIEVIKGRQEGTRFPLSGAQSSIGKGGFNDIQLSDWFVSKVHAVIERHGGQYMIRDMGSWRHTYVNGVATQEAPLADGDTIQLGPSVQLAFRLVRADAAPLAASRVPVELGEGYSPPLKASEPSQEPGEPTTKVWRPRYVEWRDPEEAQPPRSPLATAAAEQDAEQAQDPRQAGEPAQEAEYADTPSHSHGDGEPQPLWAAAEIRDKIPFEHQFIDTTLDELDEVEKDEDEPEAPPSDMMSPMPGESDGQEEPDDCDDEGRSAPSEEMDALPASESAEPEPMPGSAPAIDRRRSALEALAIALGLDEEQAEAAADDGNFPEMASDQHPADAGRLQDALGQDFEFAPEAAREEDTPAPEHSASEPINPWTSPSKADNNDPELAPEEVPWETPEEIPTPDDTTPEDAPLTSPGDEATREPAEGKDEAPRPAAEPEESGDGTASASQDADPEILREILMWERALSNKNPIIRKQAARQLFKLTGKEYDYS